MILNSVLFVSDLSGSWVGEGYNGIGGILYPPQRRMPMVGRATQIEGEWESQIFAKIKLSR